MDGFWEYQGCLGSVHYDGLKNQFWGDLQFTVTQVIYQAPTRILLREKFKQAVEEYFQYCKNKKIKHLYTREFSGMFTIRIDPSLHQAAVLGAKTRGISVVNLCRDALSKYLSFDPIGDDDHDEPTNLSHAKRTKSIQ